MCVFLLIANFLLITICMLIVILLFLLLWLSTQTVCYPSAVMSLAKSNCCVQVVYKSRNFFFFIISACTVGSWPLNDLLFTHRISATELFCVSDQISGSLLELTAGVNQNVHIMCNILMCSHVWFKGNFIFHFWISTLNQKRSLLNLAWKNLIILWGGGQSQLI